MKVFDCRAFAHVSKEKRMKLDDKVLLCIFIGHDDEQVGYKLVGY